MKEKNDKSAKCPSCGQTPCSGCGYKASNEPKFPHVKVRLVGGDGNAFAIMGKVAEAMRRAGVSKADRDEFFAEATKSTYDNVLVTAMKYVSMDVDDDVVASASDAGPDPYGREK